MKAAWVDVRVMVWWSGDLTWYAGGVERVNGDGLKVRVCFDEPVGNSVGGATRCHWIRVVELFPNALDP